MCDFCDTLLCEFFNAMAFVTQNLTLTFAEIEEMRKQMEEEMKRNQEEMEAMKKSWEERLKEQDAESMVSVYRVYLPPRFPDFLLAPTYLWRRRLSH